MILADLVKVMSNLTLVKIISKKPDVPVMLLGEVPIGYLTYKVNEISVEKDVIVIELEY